ncbi:MAG: protein-disulfide reductase DsbD family protein [Opitutales bacterium]|nr:protein-disulfide reductase DsbD family protein [Opitutales bacterium]
MNFKRVGLALLTFLACFSLSHGQFGSADLVSLSISSECDEIKPGDSTSLMIEVKVEPGWHAYWKTAGQTGFPTSIAWDLPEGISLGALQFPTPKYYEFQGLGSYVHEKTFVLLAELQVMEEWNVSQPVSFTGEFSTLVCDEANCIPFRSELKLTLPIGKVTKINGQASTVLAAAKSKLPVFLDKESLTSIHANSDFIDFSIQSALFENRAPQDFYFFPEGEFFEHGTRQNFSWDANLSRLSLRMKRNVEVAAPSRLQGVLVHPELESGLKVDLSLTQAIYGRDIPNRALATPEGQRLDSVQGYRLLWFLLAFVLLALATWVYGKTNQPHHSKEKKAAGKVLAFLTFLLAVWTGYPSKETTPNGLQWQVWSPELESRLREEGKAVYVDFTAKWCLSCQVNKRVFQTQDIITTFEEKGITPLQADWTKRGATILTALKAYGREGVPLNIYYPPSKEGIPLPEILSQGIVLEVIDSEESYLVSEANGLWAILGFALLGGMILNLMPCVFPVIGLKIMSFVKQAGEDSQRVKRHGMVFTLGVLFSFWALLGVLLFLRESLEAELGWGFQLQEPLFVFALAVFLFIFALSLSGVLDIGMSLTGIGAKVTRSNGYTGSFFSGVLATLVATPCMAPFLGAAVGAALTMDWVGAYLVFSFIAIGLALPYLVLSFFPTWISRLPKPGEWMDTFKQFMAFPLYATVAWLLWTLQSLL